MIFKKIELKIIMAITLTFNIKGNLMEEYNTTEYCAKIPCTSNFEIRKNETKCPGDNSLIELRMEQDSLEIRCSLANENVYNCLPTLNIDKVQKLRIHQCPIPEGQPLVVALKNVAIQEIALLELYDSNIGTPLTSQYFSKLDNLESLELSNNNITNIPDDLFNNVSTITFLSLSHNRLHLPLGIFENLKDLEILDLCYNNLKYIEKGTFQNQKKLKNLNLTGNALKNLTKNAFEGLESLVKLDLTNNDIEVLETDVLHHLGKLTKLILSGNRLKVLPNQLLIKNKNLEQFYLTNNSVRMEQIPNRLFNFTPKITRIELEVGLDSIPSELFVNATNLVYLSLAHNKLTQLPIGLFTDQNKLKGIDLSNNQLVGLDDVFKKTINLETLELSGNNLTNISGTSFQYLYVLKELYMNDNNLSFFDEKAFDSTRSLEKIDLANNHLTKFIYPPSSSPIPLRFLNLKNNSLTNVLNSLHITKINLLVLNELDLSFNNITTFSFIELSSLFATIKINLTNNEITKIDSNINLLPITNDEKKITVYIENNPINCDCDISTLVKHLRKEQKDISETIEIQPGRLKCSKPPNLVHREVRALTLNELLCTWNLTSCPEPCKCYMHPIAVSVVPIIVDCSNLNLTKIPDLSVIGSMNSIELNISNNYITELPLANTTGNPEVRQIYASNNLITNIGVENLPNNITILKIDNNKLGYLHPTTISKLNNTTSLQNLSLSGNNWRCDCDASEFLSFIQNRFKLISDYELIKCEKGASIKTLSQTDLCPQDHIILIVACVTLALGLISSIVAVLYYKFNQEIKVWLFAHNLCLWFVTEEELDQDKIYDAFISFSHKDEDFVHKHLMPKLENTPNPYKLCIHHRDWNAGEFIQKQIVKSVQESRKTIIVLSPNFLESHWGRMEFMTAHTNAIKESRKRVIVIMYKEIGDISNLDPEIKTYISMNTYLKWGDPMFWEKLRYALPHRPKNKKPKKELIRTGFKRSIDDQIELTIPSTSTPLVNNIAHLNNCNEVHS